MSPHESVCFLNSRTDAEAAYGFLSDAAVAFNNILPAQGYRDFHRALRILEITQLDATNPDMARKIFPASDTMEVRCPLTDNGRRNTYRLKKAIEQAFPDINDPYPPSIWSQININRKFD